VQPATKGICGAIALLVAGSWSTANGAVAATHRRAPVRAAVVQVAVTGNGDVRYTYMGRKIGDAELDRLCHDGISHKSPVTFRKVGGGGDPMNLILAKAQCLGAPAGTRKVQASSTAPHTHAKPPHKAALRP
jgi:hypothetical protein